MLGSEVAHMPSSRIQRPSTPPVSVKLSAHQMGDWGIWEAIISWAWVCFAGQERGHARGRPRGSGCVAVKEAHNEGSLRSSLCNHWCGHWVSRQADCQPGGNALSLCWLQISPGAILTARPYWILISQSITEEYWETWKEGPYTICWAPQINSEALGHSLQDIMPHGYGPSTTLTFHGRQAAVNAPLCSHESQAWGNRRVSYGAGRRT